MSPISLPKKRLEQHNDFTTAIAIVLTLFLLLANLFFIPLVAAMGPYDSGYSHGFSDAQNGGHPYLSARGGKSGHTARFLQGYNDGYAVGTQGGQADISRRPPLSSLAASADSNSEQLTSDIDGNSYAIFLLLIIGIILIIIITWKLRQGSRKYKKRHCFPSYVQEKVLKKQGHKCADCNRLLNVVDYHHKNGDRSNNKESNCQALCPNCHAIKTRREKQ